MIKLGIIFGGLSNECEISKVSASSIIKNLDKDKYDIYPVYISKDNLYYKYKKNVFDIDVLSIDEELTDLELIDNVIDYLQSFDLVWPVLHGKFGEDGTIQGLCELLNVKYVGCKVKSSSMCMDKVYTKHLFNLAGINNAKFMSIKKNNDNYLYVDNSFNVCSLSSRKLVDKIVEYLKLPVFVKASKSGSSIGVYKVDDVSDLIKYIDEAFKYDDTVLIEEEIRGREIEVGIIGNSDKLTVSSIGEVISESSYYSYDSKYKSKESYTLIPASIDSELVDKIKDVAKKAYVALDCHTLARIDFFIKNDDNHIYINEINTMPGFTSISMFPKLFGDIGIGYQELLDKIIDIELSEK